MRCVSLPNWRTRNVHIDPGRGGGSVCICRSTHCCLAGGIANVYRAPLGSGATSERFLAKCTSTCSGNTRSTGTSNLASYGRFKKWSAKRLERGKSPIRERTNAVRTHFAMCAYRNRTGVFAATKDSRSDDKDDVFETQLARSSRVVVFETNPVYEIWKLLPIGGDSLIALPVFLWGR